MWMEFFLELGQMQNYKNVRKCTRSKLERPRRQSRREGSWRSCDLRDWPSLSWRSSRPAFSCFNFHLLGLSFALCSHFNCKCDKTLPIIVRRVGLVLPCQLTPIFSFFFFFTKCNLDNTLKFKVSYYYFHHTKKSYYYLFFI